MHGCVGLYQGRAVPGRILFEWLRQNRSVPKLQDIYGLTECYGPEIGIPCPDEEGIHIFDDYVYIESLDPATGLPVLEGELGEVTLTTFVKEGIPLFRFRTHDLAAFVPGQCKCGN